MWKITQTPFCTSTTTPPRVVCLSNLETWPTADMTGYCDSALLMMPRCANWKKFQKVIAYCCSPSLIRKRHLKSPSGPSRKASKGLSACENQACQLWLMGLYQAHQNTSAAQYFPLSEAGWRQCRAVWPLTGTLVRLKGEPKVIE